jgi:putative colanic acid biosynthesis acetyltransferase WcaF
VNALFLINPLNPSSKMKVVLMRLFGARIGKKVLIKPGVNVKHPWFLTLGDHSMLGENVWIDNTFAPITIGANVCVSQGAYLTSGNHDWTDSAFGLIEKPLIIDDGAWIGAQARIMPGACVATHVVIGGGSVLSKSTEPYMIYSGNPATAVKERVMKS